MYVPPKVKLCPPEISPRLEDVTYAEVRPFQVKSIILEQMAKGRVVNASFFENTIKFARRTN
ncbi:(2Fe-2S) ferredoxin [Neobacillus sp. B4I6]|uniref:hypothetical protein n=1 Tax=Neobacillus sp. B4I6 TaxID=3373925 RepID=UPI003D22B789